MRFTGVVFDCHDDVYPCALTIRAEGPSEREYHVWLTPIEVDYLLGRLVGVLDRRRPTPDLESDGVRAGRS